MTPSAVPAEAAPRRDARRAGWLAVLVVLGVVAMHGLGCHGTTAGDSALGMAPAAPSAASLGPMTMHGADGSIAPARGGHGPLGAALLCVGVLAGAALLLLLAHRRGRNGAVLPRRRRPPRQTLALTRLSTGPPAVWAFSVIRC